MRGGQWGGWQQIYFQLISDQVEPTLDILEASNKCRYFQWVYKDDGLANGGTGGGGGGDNFVCVQPDTNTLQDINRDDPQGPTPSIIHYNNLLTH